MELAQNIYSQQQIDEYLQDCVAKLTTTHGFPEEWAKEMAINNQNEWMPEFIEIKQSGQMTPRIVIAIKNNYSNIYYEGITRL